MTTRRGFLKMAAALVAAPAIVRAESLMPLYIKESLMPLYINHRPLPKFTLDEGGFLVPLSFAETQRTLMMRGEVVSLFGHTIVTMDTRQRFTAEQALWAFKRFARQLTVEATWNTDA